MKKYTYNDINYFSEESVRQAIWENEHKIFGKFDPEILGVKVEEVEESVKEVQLSEEEIAESMRLKRNKLLQASDYYVMSDYPATEEGFVLVMEYRKALRDLTEQEGFPKNIIWPKLPKVLGGK